MNRRNFLKAAGVSGGFVVRVTAASAAYGAFLGSMKTASDPNFQVAPKQDNLLQDGVEILNTTVTALTNKEAQNFAAKAAKISIGVTVPLAAAGFMENTFPQNSDLSQPDEPQP